VWLHQQLQQLLDGHAVTDTLNEQRLQQPAQDVLARMQPGNLLLQQQQQQHGRLSPSRPQTNKAALTKPPAADEDSQAVEAATGLCNWQDTTGLHAQTSQLLLAARQPGGPLDVARLQQQEALYSAAFNELCR
jgi:hypothetical protein